MIANVVICQITVTVHVNKTNDSRTGAQSNVNLKEAPKQYMCTMVELVGLRREG